MNMALLEKVRCMLSNTCLSKYFWAEALVYACNLVNKLFVCDREFKTPLEAWSEKVAQDFDLLRIFGCSVYYHIKEDKLDPRAKKSVSVGFKKGLKRYKIWDLKDKKFIRSRDCHI